MRSEPSATSVSPRFRLVPPAVSSAGPEAIELAAAAGLILDPWQADALTDILLEDEAGLWAATTAAIIEQRRNGKGSILEARELVGLVLFGEEITHSAHRFDTSLDAHQRLVSLFDPPEFRRLVDKILYRPTPLIRLKSGAMITFRTRTAHGARGLGGDVVVLDEAYNIGPGVMAALVPTMSARPNMQLIYASSGPRPGVESDQLRKVIRRGRAGKATRTVYIEHSADPDKYRRSEEELAADPALYPIDILNPQAWADANPAHPFRISVRAIELEYEELTPEDFALERLGIWLDDDSQAETAFDLTQWARLADPSAEQRSKVVFGVDVGVDRLAHVAAAWKRPDGLVQITLAETDLSPLRTPRRIAEIEDSWGCPVMLGGPAASLEDDLDRATVMSGPDFAAACGRFDDLLSEGLLRHDNQPELTRAVEDADWRPFGSSGAKTLQLRDAPTVAPLAAVIRALHGLLTAPSPPPPPVKAHASTAPRRSSSSGTADLASMSF